MMKPQKINSCYQPKEIEEKWYKYWERRKYFTPKIDKKKKPYSVVIPPPNVTGVLHMGHALNNVLQDILIRWKRMQGFSTLWLPGTDHAGIATQNVVERRLRQKGLKREDLGREKFIDEVWRWKEEHGSTIIEQLKKLGCSCDWSRERFTMDEKLSDAVQEVFIKLYQDGLIYRGNYIINWCPRCQTALSDEETLHKEVQGNLYYIKYPLKKVTSHQSPVTSQETESSQPDFVVVATTRPETMFGDIALAINPSDKRFKHLLGKKAIVPIIEREIDIIEDDHVTPEFGTGVVKITPFHDANDFDIANRHNLSGIFCLNLDATMNANAGENYQGMDRFEARESLIEDLRERKLLIKIEAHQHAVGHCYRCHTMIEPYLSRQWFVKMKPLAEKAIEVVEREDIKFYPRRWTKVYLNWMENIRDWCISRQIWWGHRLPVYYCRKCQEETGSQSPATPEGKSPTSYGAGSHQPPENKRGIIVSKTKPQKCPYCGSKDIEQDEDVLDTWFSSWLWPFSAFGWPGKQSTEGRGQRAKDRKPKTDLDYFYPTSALVTAPEIIFFWVARMIMAGMKFMDAIPFRDVYIHGTVRDNTGKKMSKSLGNTIDPLEIIEKFGADALRFSIVFITATGQDVFLSEQKFIIGRNFANKIWNASRYILQSPVTPEGKSPTSYGAGSHQSPVTSYQKTEDREQRTEDRNQKTENRKLLNSNDLELKERWILSRLNQTIKEIDRCLQGYRFQEAEEKIYEFFWHQFCDWYIELAKPVRATTQEPVLRFPQPAEITQDVLCHILETSMRLLHPFMPFISEEIWQRVRKPASRFPLPASRNPQPDSLIIADWPVANGELIDRKVEQDMGLLIEIIKTVRNLCAELGIKDFKKGKLILVHFPERLKHYLHYIFQLTGIKDIICQNKKPQKAISAVVEKSELHLVFEDVNLCGEKKRLQEKVEGLQREKERISNRLGNKEFLNKAPKEIIEKNRTREKEVNAEEIKLKNIISQL